MYCYKCSDHQYTRNPTHCLLKMPTVILAVSLLLYFVLSKILLLHIVLRNPNNSLVAIDDLIKMFTGELTAEEKYNQQLESLDRFDKTYVQPIFDIDVFASQKGNGSEGLDASVSDKAENARIINKYLDLSPSYLHSFPLFH